MVLEKTLESPLDYKEIQPVNHKGNHPWIFIGRADDAADAEAEAPIICPPDGKNWVIWKMLMLGTIEAGREGEDRMRWWHQQVDGHELE